MEISYAEHISASISGVHHIVTKVDGVPVACTCPGFLYHPRTPKRCKHILAEEEDTTGVNPPLTETPGRD